MLFHDAMLSRTTNGAGPLSRRTFEQLHALDAGGWFSPDFAGERVPSFEEALERLRGRIGRIYAEVKGYRELEDLDRMVQLAREAGVLDHLVFISLNWPILDRMRGREPGLSVGYVVDDAGEVDEAIQRAQGDPNALLDLRTDLVLGDRALAGRLAREGLETAVWTVDDPAEAAQLYDLGVYRLTTNQVGALVSWKRGT